MKIILQIKVTCKITAPINNIIKTIESMKITPGQMKNLHRLLNEAKKSDADSKKELVFVFTNGRETSSKELTFKEAKALIDHLEAFLKTLKTQKIPTSEQRKYEACDRMRKKIITLLRDYGMEKFNKEKGRMVADMPAIYALIKKVGYLKKPLNDYNGDELPKLVTQVEQIHFKDLIKSERK